MEHGNVTWMRSAQYKNDVAVYKSVRKPGCVYKFFRKRGTEYCCCHLVPNLHNELLRTQRSCLSVLPSRSVIDRPDPQVYP